MKALERVLGRAIVVDDADVSDPEGLSEFADPSCPVCHGYGVVRRNVPTTHQDFGKAFTCQCAAARLRQRRIDRLEAHIPEDYRAYTFDNYPAQGDQRALERARLYAAEDSGSLFLWGPVRRGKTSLAACIARACIGRGDDVLFTNVPRLLEQFRRSFDRETGGLTTQAIADVLEQSTLVVLDDIGAERPTPWVTEQLYRLIDYRQSNRKRTVYTSNLSLEELRGHLDDERIPWRIKAHCGDAIVKVAGANLND